MHNGGPCGHTRDNTLGYQRKIERCMAAKNLTLCLEQRPAGTTPEVTPGGPLDPFNAGVSLYSSTQESRRINNQYARGGGTRQPNRGGTNMGRNMNRRSTPRRGGGGGSSY